MALHVIKRHFALFVASVYRYHKEGKWREIPYTSTLLSILIILYVNFGSFLLVSGFNSCLPSLAQYGKGTQYLIGSAVLSALLFIMMILFPLKKIKRYEATLTDGQFRRYKTVWFCSFILTAIVFGVVGIYRAKHS